jgi:maltose/maltodextrin transport system permease protein
MSIALPSRVASAPRPPILKWTIAVALALACLYLVFNIYATGQVAWAVGVFALCACGFIVYLSNVNAAYRYLFPGLAAMAVFVAFPLLYTAQIGFTNYSSNNLLSEERAKSYLTEQRWPDEARMHSFDLYAEGSQFRVVVKPRAADMAGFGATGADATANANSGAFTTPPIALRDRDADAPIRLEALANVPAQAPLKLAEVLKHRDVLMRLSLELPDKSPLQYAGVREFAPLTDVWKQNSDGSLTLAETGAVYKPNRDTGYFENATGERMQPGFKVGVGLANFTRMFRDENFRGPFISIFIWTVAFSALTVFATVAVGMPLAVLLNWEQLQFRGVYRMLLFLPYAVPAFISILVFKGLFNQNFGEINTIINALFGVKPAWFADPLLAKIMILIVNTWLGYPYIMILCSGLIKAIPADLYEASALAGASPLVNFFKITAPLIIKPLTPLLITVFAFNFNNFVVIALLTDGRPDFLNTKVPAGTTDILVSYTYRIAFQDSGQNFGLAAAVSTVIFFMVAALSLANIRLTKINAENR